MNNAISRIGIENFKSFGPAQELSLAPITLLVGPNNSGKSTIIQAINILKESFGLDDRQYISLETFVRTRIKSSVFKERYGKLKEYLHNKENKQFNITVSLEQPWLLNNFIAEFNIRVTEDNEGIIDSLTIKDGISNKYIIKYFLQLSYNDINTALYIYKIDHSAIINRIKDSSQTFSSWREKLIDASIVYTEYINNRINDLEIIFVDKLLKKIPEEKLIEHSFELIDIIKKHVDIDDKLFTDGFILLNQVINKEIYFDVDDEDIKTRNETIINILNSDGHLISILMQIFYIYLGKSYNQFKKYQTICNEYYLSAKLKYGEEYLLNVFFKKLELKEIIDIEIENTNKFINNLINDCIPSRAKKYFRYEMIESHVDSLLGLLYYDFLESSLGHLEYTDIVGQKYKLVQLHALYSQFEKDWNTGNIFCAKSLLESENYFLKTEIPKILSRYLGFNKNTLKKTIECYNEIDLMILSKISEIEYPIHEELDFFLNDFFSIDFNIEKNEKIEDIKTIHYNILWSLSNELPSELKNEMKKFGYHSNDIMAMEIHKKNNQIKNIKDSSLYLNHEFEKIFQFIYKLLLYKYLDSNNLMPLVTKKKSVNYQRRSKKEFLIDKSNDEFYFDLLKKINLDKIINNITESPSDNKKSFMHFYEKLSKSNLSVLHNNLRNILSKNIYYLPATKTSFKKTFSIDHDQREPIVKIFLFDHTLKYRNSYQYENKYLMALNLNHILKIEFNIESDTASIYVEVDGVSKNIMNEGHGIAQLTILCHLFAVCARNNENKNQVIFIEEPEISLHPALQSKLADVLRVACEEDGLQVIVETHSEYLIRKLQYLAAKGEINNKNVTIYYFSKPTSSEHDERVYRIDIDEKGSLSRPFGKGFFDEANSIALDLVIHNMKNNN
jgi:predicted ATPase